MQWGYRVKIDVIFEKKKNLIAINNGVAVLIFSKRNHIYNTV